MKLHEVAEGRGRQVMLFSDYVQRLAQISDEAAKQVPHFKKLGATLFREGFTYDDTSFHLLPDTGGVYELDFPSVNNTGYAEEGWVVCHFYIFVKGKKRTFQRMVKVTELNERSGPDLLNWIRGSAQED
jgi:hypothetical protein